MNESLFSKELLQCPVCLNEEGATIWQTVQADVDPDLKDRLLRKTLQTQQCLNCGHVWIPARPLLFCDSNAKLIVYCNSGQTESQTRQVIADLASLPQWTLRLTGDYNDLIEKIHISDHHCDDRLVEVVKLALRQQSQQDEGDDIEQIYFLTADDRAFRFMAAAADGQWFSLDLDSDVYLNAEKLISEHLTDGRGQWLVVDANYAAELLKDMTQG